MSACNVNKLTFLSYYNFHSKLSRLYPDHLAILITFRSEAPLMHAHSPSLAAQRLGYAGLIPFVLCATLLWIVQTDLRPWLAIALASYSALIASFLGGIHWGIAAQRPAHEQFFHYAWGVVSSVVAWVALIMPAYAGLPVLGVLLVVCYLVDRRSYASAGWSAWLPLRLRLTVVAALSCLIGAGAM
jgi:hypothetical protein